MVAYHRRIVFNEYNMSVFMTLLGVVLLISIILTIFVTRRVFAYNLNYRLPEDKYTKLFRVFTKEHFLILYFVFAGGHTIFVIWFLINL